MNRQHGIFEGILISLILAISLPIMAEDGLLLPALEATETWEAWYLPSGQAAPPLVCPAGQGRQLRMDFSAAPAGTDAMLLLPPRAWRLENVGAIRRFRFAASLAQSLPGLASAEAPYSLGLVLASLDGQVSVLYLDAIQLVPNRSYEQQIAVDNPEYIQQVRHIDSSWLPNVRQYAPWLELRGLLVYRSARPRIDLYLDSIAITFDTGLLLFDD